jgi:hypothetical protein
LRTESQFAKRAAPFAKSRSLQAQMNKAFISRKSEFVSLQIQGGSVMRAYRLAQPSRCDDHNSTMTVMISSTTQPGDAVLGNPHQGRGVG